MAEHPEIDNIIGTPPSWLISRGTIVIGLIIVAIFAGAWLISFPNILSSPVLLPDSMTSRQLVLELPLEKGTMIKPGQRATIKSLRFPFEEYGWLSLRVKSSIRINRAKFYTVILELPQNQITTKGYHITNQFLLSSYVEFNAGQINILNKIIKSISHEAP